MSPRTYQSRRTLEVRFLSIRDKQRVLRLNGVTFFSSERWQDCAPCPKCAELHTISSRNHRNPLKLNTLKPLQMQLHPRLSDISKKISEILVS